MSQREEVLGQAEDIPILGTPILSFIAVPLSCLHPGLTIQLPSPTPATGTLPSEGTCLGLP